MPEVYEAIVPEDVKLIADSPELREAQMRGLAKIEQYSQEGLGVSERLAAQDAAEGISREYGRGTQSILRDLGARGRLSGGDEAQLRMVGQQGASNLARGLGSDLMRERVDARQRASYALPGVAGSIREQDTETQRYNAEAQNRHNELISKMRTDAARYAAAARQEAQNYNVANQQGVADQNVQADYVNRLENINRRNDLERDKFNAATALAAGKAGALNTRGYQKDQDRAAREQTIVNLGQGAGGAAGGAVSYLSAPKAPDPNATRSGAYG
jgi:hypothetical protein